MRKGFVFVLVLIGIHAFGSDSIQVDLKKSWLMMDEGKLVPHSGEGRVAHVKLSELGSGVIQISSRQHFNVFVNNRLVASRTSQFKMPVGKTVGGQGLLTVFSNYGVDQLSLSFISPGQQDLFSRKPNSVSSALILFSILLAAGLIVLIRTNGSAAMEYFNFIKLFSLRGTEDSAQIMRITSANNIFYYLFCSALLAVNLYVLYKGNTLLGLSFGTVMMGILKLMALVFGVLMAKISLLGLLAGIFKLTDFGPSQFHNYVRLLLVSFIFCSAFLLILVMVDADFSAWFTRLSYFIVGMSIVFVGITFLKLMARGGFTVFHLFSYLCASEIIPLIILLNVYFS
ncbi:MAG: DUF4271 domain-containing protein [Proteobacteria bacterium]|nr:DUF4271 domain-containing protein [Pseudomonadota bacterium]